MKEKVNLILSLEEDIESLYQGRKLIGPYRRTLSRLEEMRSREYLSKPHLG
jgi:Predicted ATPase